MAMIIFEKGYSWLSEQQEFHMVQLLPSMPQAKAGCSPVCSLALRNAQLQGLASEFPQNRDVLKNVDSIC